MRTVLNSFPILCSIWNDPSAATSSSPPSPAPHSLPRPSLVHLAPCSRCHLELSARRHLHHLSEPSLPPWWGRLCLFSKPFFYTAAPSPVPSHAPLPSPPLFSTPFCLVYTRLLACPLSFQPLKAFQAANKRQVPTTTKGLRAAFE